MIINIPLQVDEKRMEELIERDYQGKVLEAILDQVKKTLAKSAENIYSDRVSDGMRVLVEKQIRDYLKEHNEEIVTAAATNLAERLARSKKGREILEDLE